MRVVWGEGARTDFLNAIAFIEEQSPAGAKRVGERILHAVKLLEQFPEIPPPSRHRGLRQFVVARTPYLVVYRVHDDQVESEQSFTQSKSAAGDPALCCVRR